ncbi:MAG: hypothetical protein IH612_11390 [Desulfofustis sp.]|nr:hypothetical protein [Desulfofustis sp.]
MSTKGRPYGTYRITRHQISVLSQQFRLGANIKAACIEAGIGTTNYYRYLERSATATEGILVVFREKVIAAQEAYKAECEAKGQTWVKAWLLKKYGHKDGLVGLQRQLQLDSRI